VPAIEALIPLSVRSLQAEHYSREQMEGALGTVFGVDTQLIRDGTYFVAEAGGEIVGCGGWSRRKTLFGSDRAKAGEDPQLDPKHDAARIRAFFVHPEWARRGIGSEIMRRSEAAAIAARFHRIEIVATLTGEALYAKFGYAVVERYDVPLANGYRLPVVRMAKQR
jgi:predicted N-acetyltransferase YhbS